MNADALFTHFHIHLLRKWTKLDENWQTDGRSWWPNLLKGQLNFRKISNIFP